jgi:hypothetical protein
VASVEDQVARILLDIAGTIQIVKNGVTVPDRDVKIVKHEM